MRKLVAVLFLMCAGVCAQNNKLETIPSWKHKSPTSDEAKNGWVDVYTLTLANDKARVDFEVSFGKGEKGQKVALQAIGGSYFWAFYEENGGGKEDRGACYLLQLFNSDARKRPGLPPETSKQLDAITCSNKSWRPK